MGLFSKKPAICTVCKKETKHKHKAKKEWYVESPLCGDCYMDKMKESYDSNIKAKCVVCGKQSKITDLWEPRWQWDMKGLLCKTCFDNKEADFIVIDLKATELIKNKLETANNIKDILFNLMTLGDDRLIKEVYILGQNIYQKKEA